MTVDLARLPEALRDHGVSVVEFGRWQARGYDDVAFVGQLNHHTGAGGPVGPGSARYMVDGRPPSDPHPLPGPLCNAHGGLDSTDAFVVYLIAGRRARHAGPGARTVYNEYLADQHVPLTALQRDLPDDDTAHGNRHLFGWEWQHPGDTTAWLPALVVGIGRCNAALAELAGWTPERSKGHKHWTRRKIDPSWPGSLPDLTRRYLEDDVALTNEEIDKIADRVVAKMKPVMNGVVDGQLTQTETIVKDRVDAATDTIVAAISDASGVYEGTLSLTRKT